jgi:hypothetical protein
LIIDYKAIKDSEKLESKLDMLAESSPVSDYENFTFFQQRVQHRSNLSYQNLEIRLRDIFKTIDAEIFVDKRKDFERIKKKLLAKQHNLSESESKLRRFFRGDTIIKESANYIKECMSDRES